MTFTMNLIEMWIFGFFLNLIDVTLSFQKTFGGNKTFSHNFIIPIN